MKIQLYKQKKKLIGKKNLIIVLSFLGILFYFSLLNGDSLIELNLKITESILPLLQPFYDSSLQFDANDLGNRISINLGSSAIVKDVASAMENWIHIILFFIFTCIVLFAFQKLWTNNFFIMIIAIAICCFFAYFSEILQYGILHRGYEDKDVINNLIGVGTGVFAYVLYAIVKKIRKTIKKSSVPKKIVFDFMNDTK